MFTVCYVFLYYIVLYYIMYKLYTCLFEINVLREYNGDRGDSQIEEDHIKNKSLEVGKKLGENPWSDSCICGPIITVLAQVNLVLQ